MNTAKNYSWHAFLVLLVAMFLMLLYSAIHPHVPILARNFNNIYDLKKIMEVVVPSDTIAQDSIISPPADAKTVATGLDTTFITEVSALQKFFMALQLTKKEKKKTRIAYYGDSLIEGDLITQSLRELFQKYFGGGGVGYVPMTSEVNGFRTSVRHNFSGNWTKYNPVKAASKRFPFGPSGETFVVKGDAVLSYQSSAQLVGTATFPQVHLYYGPVLSDLNVADTVTKAPDSLKTDTATQLKGGRNYIQYGNSEKIYLDGKQRINELVLSAVPSTKCTIKFHAEKDQALYGMRFSSVDGVGLDNFSLRGNSGLPLTSISSQMLQAFDVYSSYDLIVLHFGTNVISSSASDFSWYKTGLDRVVKHFQTALPEASILIISPLDKATKLNGVLVTDPSVPKIVEVEKQVAADNGVCFINLYEWMQGDNSIVQWANAQPALANKDYTHPNGRGAEKIGAFLYELLSGRYQKFEKNQLSLPPATDTNVVVP